MTYYPAYLDLRDRPCLVIGGGGVAERKALSLLEAGAELTIISPTLTPTLQELSDSGKITHRQKSFDEKNDLSGMFLVIAATDSPRVNIAAAQACKKKHILVNVIVPPEESTFIVPSVVKQGELAIAVSTGGASPALAKKIRQELESKYGPEYAFFLDQLGAIRRRVFEEVGDAVKRRAIFQEIVDSEVIDLLKQGKRGEAELRMKEIAGLKNRA